MARNSRERRRPAAAARAPLNDEAHGAFEKRRHLGGNPLNYSIPASSWLASGETQWYALRAYRPPLAHAIRVIVEVEASEYDLNAIISEKLNGASEAGAIH